MRTGVYVSDADTLDLCVVTGPPGGDDAHLPDRAARRWVLVSEVEAAEPALPDLPGVDGNALASEIAARGVAVIRSPALTDGPVAVFVSGADPARLCFVSSFPRHDIARLPEPNTWQWRFFSETSALMPEIVGVGGALVVAKLALAGFAVVQLGGPPSLWPYGQRQLC